MLFSTLTIQQQDWNELLKEVISFNTVEEFWGIYVRLPFRVPVLTS